MALGIRGHDARRARAELARVFSRIIQARRASGAHEDDILQCFIDARYEKVRALMCITCVIILRTIDKMVMNGSHHMYCGHPARWLRAPGS